jgi:polyphosphate kinase
VELKARFDEESNISWARMLEREGVHVVYGLLGLKTHAKTLLVVRRDEDRVRRYMHLGTGNYNAATARVYEDFGLFTADEELGADVTDLFNYLTGYSALTSFRKLLVAPLNLRPRLTELIDREIKHAKAGQEAHIIVKCNSLVDEAIIRRLYAASRAGVSVDLIVRGMCSLRPGLPGVSENIRVRSIVGRFLEHSRVFCFHNRGETEVFLGSADVMLRNLDHRVEVVFPVTSRPLVSRIRDRILASYLTDDSRARLMNPDGTYSRAQRGNGKANDSQEAFLVTAGKGKE